MFHSFCAYWRSIQENNMSYYFVYSANADRQTLVHSFRGIGEMGKRSCLKLVVISVMSLLALTQSAHADLMKIDFSIGPSIPSNNWTVEFRTLRYWLTVAAGYHHGTSDIFNFGTFIQMLVFDKESLTLSLDVLMETIGGDTDVFTASFDGTAFYSPITDFGSNSFRGIASVPFYDLSKMIGKKSILDSNLWH